MTSLPVPTIGLSAQGHREYGKMMNWVVNSAKRKINAIQRVWGGEILRSFSKAPTKKLTVALLGRPNTGKSTLFNRLTKTKGAIVSNVPGTTRDRKEGKAELGGQSFMVYDTGGYDDRGVVSTDIQKQVQSAIAQSNIILFMVDSKVGITALDEQFARWIRLNIGKHHDKATAPEVVLVANKAESGYMSDEVVHVLAESYKLGFGEPLLLSAMHGDGLTDLATRLFKYAEAHGFDDNGVQLAKPMPEMDPILQEILEPPPIDEATMTTVHLAIMGRPNVGKSTLLNAIVGEERVIAGELPGLTRDAIPVEWEYDNRPFRLVDTAGLTRISTNRNLLAGVKEKKMRPLHDVIGKHAANDPVTLPGLKMVNTEEDPSQYSSQISEFALLSALNALRYAQIVLLVVESTQGNFKKIDLQLARKCLMEGRGLLIVANKFDELEERGLTIKEYEAQVKEHCDEYLREFGDIPIVVTTGKEGRGVGRLLRTAVEVHDSWTRRISTSVLNTWLQDTMVTFPSARAGAKAVKIKYITQVKAGPPTFSLFANVSELPGSFERFFRGKLQEDFHLKGVPIRFIVKKSVGNPAKKHLLAHGKHSSRGRGRGDSKGRVGPNRKAKRILKRIKGTVLQRRKKDKRVRNK